MSKVAVKGLGDKPWVIPIVLLAIVIAVFFSFNFGLFDSLGGKEVMNPIIVFETTVGNFEVELFLDKMPITAGNFFDLVKKDFYNGIIFHRVIPNFMIQGGDPKGTGSGGPGYSIDDEFVNGLSNLRGTLSMANSGPNSGGSQFFINLVDNTYLDFDKPPLQSKHPVFGKIVSGMDIIDVIGGVDTISGDRPKEEIVMNKVFVKG